MADSFPFVTVRGFTPNTRVNWQPLGQVQTISADTGRIFILQIANEPNPVRLSFLSRTCLRVQFSPVPIANYHIERSVSVVNRTLGNVQVNVNDASNEVAFDTGAMQVRVDKAAFRLRVYRNQQLVHADDAGFGLVYIPGQTVTANFKMSADGARYSGVAEKAGSKTLKNGYSLTNFNWDNYGYNNSPLPPGNEQGPLNPAAALYCSVPFLLETNPAPGGAFAGPAYACGVFFDNACQTFFNIGADDYGTSMAGKYYFGALYNDLDYYFMLGEHPIEVLRQFTDLTGRSPMPPRYVFGFHQGAYGYYDRSILENIANAYRRARFPLDGLHIDVDFQDNYRTFTHSELKFPQAAAMFAGLRQSGFKCSTNITPLLTRNPLNERGQPVQYQQRSALLAMGGLIYNTRAGAGPNAELFDGKVSYGLNQKVNPNYAAYPGLQPNIDGNLPLGVEKGNYPDFGRADVRAVWGQQYAHLVNDLGIEMIWQDMTCPALALTPDTPCKTFPLDLMTNDTVGYVPHSLMHNAYSGLLLRATWEGLRQLRPTARNFIIARGGFAGMQRYAGLWTGDSGSTWDFLRVTLTEVLNNGISGIPISGADVGGFGNLGDPNGTAQPATYPGRRVVGGKTNYELLTRWMQMGSFLPWYRNHYDGYNKEFQEPIMYGEPVPTNTRKYVELRYRMMQLYYDCMYEWTQTGMPIARALFLNDPMDVEAYHLDDQFFVGRDLLVAPILQQWETAGRPGPAIRDVYVPAGTDWYAFKDDIAALEPPVPGGTLISGYRAGLDLVPLYVRAGGIIPMRQLEQYVGELSQNPLTLTIYPGPDRDYLVYQDDGVSTQAEAGVFRTTRVSHATTGMGRSVNLRREHDQFQPPEAFYRIALLGMARPSGASVDNAPLVERSSAAALDTTAADGYYWDVTKKTVYVKLMDNRPQTSVTVIF